MTADLPQFSTIHSHPSSLDSGSKPKDFAARAKALGAVSLTCTDHGTLEAAHEVYSLAKAKSLIPCIGLEAYFRSDTCPILTKLGIPKTDTVPRGSDRDAWLARYPQGTFFDYNKYYHLTLGFLDYKAYLCAVRLISRADTRAEQHGSERKPLFDWPEIEELAAHNVTASSSCLVGMVSRHLVGANNLEAAAAYLKRLHHLFGDRFYVEVFPHACTHDFVKKVFVDVGLHKPLQFTWTKKLRTEAGEFAAEQIADSWKPNHHGKLLAVKHYHTWTPVEEPLPIRGVKKTEGFIENEPRPWAQDSDVQRGCNRFVLAAAKKYNIPVLIGDDSHLATQDDKIVQDIRLSQGGPWKFHTSYHLMSSAEAFAHFQRTLGTSELEFRRWIDNSLTWADRFKGFKFESKPSLPTKFFPADTMAHLKGLISHHGRMRMERPYVDRLKAEIDILQKNGVIKLLPYFFPDEEVCRLYNDGLGWLTGPGRGSAAGLYLSYLMGITHVDPIRYGLSLERFITPDRIASGALPDIDQDLPNRDPLEGYETDVVEFQAADGTTHIVPEVMKIPTDRGLMTIAEAAAAGAEVTPWWKEKELADPDSAQQ